MNDAAPPKEPLEQSIRKADPCVMVIFGATGDLTKRKLAPRLCNLVAAKLFGRFRSSGVAINDLSTKVWERRK